MTTHEDFGELSNGEQYAGNAGPRPPKPHAELEDDDPIAALIGGIHYADKQAEEAGVQAASTRICQNFRERASQAGAAERHSPLKAKKDFRLVLGLSLASVALVVLGLVVGGGFLRNERDDPKVAANLKAMETELKQFRETFDILAKLTLDENTLAQVHVARALGQAEQVRTLTAGWSPAILDIQHVPTAELTTRIALRAGSEFFMLGNYPLAERLFLRVRVLFRGDTPSEVYMALVNVAKLQGDYVEAAARLREMLGKPYSDADQSRAANLLAYCLYEQALRAKGEEKARLVREGYEAVATAIRLADEEGYAKVYVQKSLLLDLQGKKEESRQALVEARRIAKGKLQKFPESPRLLWTLAIVAARLGEQEEALNKLREAIAVESREFPVSFWAATEPAFDALFDALKEQERKQVREQFDGILGKAKYTKGYLPITITGMLWDEPFSQPQHGRSAAPEPAET